MHRRRRRPDTLLSSINVVPFLDVLLVLLVIFLVTAPLLNQSTVNLPQVDDSALPPPEAANRAALEIVYQKDGGDAPYILINHMANGDTTEGLTESDILALVDSQIKEAAILYEQENPKLILSADGDLAYKQVIALLGKLHQAGYGNIGIAVEGAAAP